MCERKSTFYPWNQANFFLLQKFYWYSLGSAGSKRHHGLQHTFSLQMLFQRYLILVTIATRLNIGQNVWGQKWFLTHEIRQTFFFFKNIIYICQGLQSPKHIFSFKLHYIFCLQMLFENYLILVKKHQQCQI